MRILSRAHAGIVLAVLFLMLLPSVAAHENLLVAQGPLTLEPGESLAIPTQLHYHRLVGEVKDGEGAQVALRLEGPDGIREIAGPSAAFVVNELVRCCKGETWTPHTVVLVNHGTQEVTLDVRLALLHDGIAVVGDDAEAGAAVSMLLPFVIASVIFAKRLRLPPLVAPARAWLRASVVLLALLWGIASLLALWGMGRFGGGPVGAIMALPADLPWVGNAFVTTVDFIVLGLMVLWLATTAVWTGAARRGPHDRRVAVLGVAIGAGTLLACLAWAIEYRQLLVPLLLAASAAPVPILVGLRLLRRRA